MSLRTTRSARTRLPVFQAAVPSSITLIASRSAQFIRPSRALVGWLAVCAISDHVGTSASDGEDVDMTFGRSVRRGPSHLIAFPQFLGSGEYRRYQRAHISTLLVRERGPSQNSCLLMFGLGEPLYISLRLFFRIHEASRILLYIPNVG